MPTLYVTEPDSQEESGAPDEKRRTLAGNAQHRLGLVALVGRVHVTADAFWACLGQGITLA